jgi:hypothetical protein
MYHFGRENSVCVYPRRTFVLMKHCNTASLLVGMNRESENVDRILVWSEREKK